MVFLKNLGLLALVIGFQSTVFAASLETPTFHGRLGVFSLTPGSANALPGKYLRKQVSDSSGFDERVVGRILGTQRAGTSSCTGTLIGSRYVLTAAHCVYNLEQKTWGNDFKFIPGQTQDNRMPFGISSWEKVYIHRAYFDNPTAATTSRAFEHDYAVIVLKEKIGENLGWMGFASVANPTSGISGTMTGYPGDKTSGSLWTVTCPMIVQGTQWLFQCDAFQGMSGSSIRGKNASGEERVLGIFDWVQANNDGYNGGVVINDAIFAQLRSWVSDAPDADTVTYKNNNTDVVEVYVRNQCAKDDAVSVAVHYFALDGQWVTASQWRSIPKGETQKVLTTFSEAQNFQLLGYSKAANLTWGGDFGVYFKGEVANFKTIPLSEASRASGIMIYSLTCP